MSKVKQEIFSSTLQDSYKMTKSDFTRTRKQSFPTTLLFMISRLTKSLSLEIENFITFLRKDCGLLDFKTFTKSAFVQYRKKISADVFKKLSTTLTMEFYSNNESGVKLWKGFRLLAVDGSFITLPITKELEIFYGKTKNQTKTSIVQARVSVLYDVLNHYVLDGLLVSRNTGERELALLHLEYCQDKDLIIYDRGYPSFGFIYEHYQRKFDFLMRVKVDFSEIIKTFVACGKVSKIVEIYPGKNTNLQGKTYSRNTSITVRLIRIELPSGEVEVLITSLLNNKMYKNKIFKELYFKRWKVERFYDQLKNKLKVEHFSGYSNQSILQDFNATLFISNLQTLIVSNLEEELNKKSTTKYQYKVNTNLSYGFLKNRVIKLFLSEKNMESIVLELQELFKKHLVPIRPNRSSPRNSGKYRTRIKPKVTKNQKDAI